MQSANEEVDNFIQPIRFRDGCFAAQNNLPECGGERDYMGCGRGVLIWLL